MKTLIPATRLLIVVTLLLALTACFNNSQGVQNADSTMTGYVTTSGLIDQLNKQGVQVIIRGDKLRMILWTDHLFNNKLQTPIV